MEKCSIIKKGKKRKQKQKPTIIEEENNNNIASDVHLALTFYPWVNCDNEDHDYKIIHHSLGKKEFEIASEYF